MCQNSSEPNLPTVMILDPNPYIYKFGEFLKNFAESSLATKQFVQCGYVV